MRYLRAVLFFLVTVAIYLGLPLLGWGIGDLRGFFSLYPRLGYAVLVAAFGLAVAYQAVEASEGIRGSRGDESKLLHRQSVVGMVMILVLYAALVFLPFADRRSIGVMMVGLAVRWPGLVLCGLGYTLVFWSGVALGRMYSQEVTIQEGHQLITKGLYHYIRHPRYLGVIMLALGESFLFRSWIGLLATIPVCGMLLYRIKDEEAVLHQEFGEEWEAYCKRSWRLIPHLF